MRQINPKLKILISVGGWFASMQKSFLKEPFEFDIFYFIFKESTPFNKILKSITTRNTFIQNVLNFLRHWNFDGLGLFALNVLFNLPFETN